MSKYVMIKQQYFHEREDTENLAHKPKVVCHIISW